jgi:hypothetical protein
MILSSIHKWLMAKRQRSSLRTFVSDDADGTYFSIYDALDPLLPKTFEIAPYRGLIFCHVIKDANSPYVVSYWKSRHSFDNYGARFASACLCGQIREHGAISDYRAKEVNWWTKYPFWTAVITLSALLAAFLSLWEQGAKLFEAPDIYIEMSADHPDNLLAANNTSRLLKFVVTNRCRFTPVSVDLRSELARSQSRTPPIAANEIRLSRIAPGSSREFSVRPDVSSAGRTSGAAPVAYVVRLIGQEQAGLWRKKTISFESPPVSVWKALDGQDPSLAATADGSCLMQGTVYSGRKQAAAIKATVSHPSKAIQSVVIATVVNGNTFVSGPDTMQVSGDHQTVNQSLRMPQLEQYRQYDYSVTTMGTDLKANECGQIKVKMHYFGGT